MWLMEWVRLREARKREIALKREAVEVQERPHLVRMQALTKLHNLASRNVKFVSYIAGDREAWKIQANVLLPEVLGDFHPLLDELDSLWSYEEPAHYLRDRWEQEDWRKAVGILEAAITSYTFMNVKIQESTIANTLDPDLITRVDHVFRLEDWTAVASLAATFVEDRFRSWAGLDQNTFGVNLMTKVLHPDSGIFPLGTIAGESEGWHQLGRGFMSACSNVDRHRIQDRDDLRRYAVGVLGTASLLLTQMRHQHGNRFKGE